MRRQVAGSGESGPVGAHVGSDGAVQSDGGGPLRPATRARDVSHGDARVEQALGTPFAHGVAGVGSGVESGGAERLAQAGEKHAPG